MADEVTSHNKEQLALCVHFVDDSEEVMKLDFLAVLHLSQMTGKATAQTIVSTLNDLGIDILNIRGQGYDRAANMSSANVGVHTRV